MVSSTRETVLLVEDEELVRRFVQTVLETDGYDVIVAADGQDALRLLELRAGPVHLVVTDVRMPRMTGLEFVALARRNRPTLGVLFISGYTDAALVEAAESPDGVLSKPFGAAELSRRVRTVLDRASSEAGADG